MKSTKRANKKTPISGGFSEENALVVSLCLINA